MNDTVVWQPEASRRLATIWTQAADRSAIAKAAHVIDKALGAAPQEAGESREEGFRVRFERPLGVVFEVSPQDRLVRVVAVWNVV